MKKTIIATLALVASVVAANAQTEFRHITFEEAKAAAKAENKKIFIDFYTSWCGPCKRLAANVFPTKEVGDYLNANYVCLKLDAEKEGAELAKQFNVSAYPTLAVVSADGTLIGSFAGAKEGEEFIAAVETCNDPELKEDLVKARYEKGDRTPKIVHAYADMILDNARDYMSGMEKSQKVIGEYYDSLSDEARVLPENKFMFTKYTHDYSSPRFKFMLDNQHKFPQEISAEISKVIKNVYMGEASNYFTDKSKSTTSATYQQFKKEAAELGLLPEFGKRLEFAEKRAVSNDKDYLDFCDLNFTKLSPDEQQSFLYYITQIFSTETAEQRMSLSSLVRKHIGTLTPECVYFGATAIMNLEK